MYKLASVNFNYVFLVEFPIHSNIQTQPHENVMFLQFIKKIIIYMLLAFIGTTMYGDKCIDFIRYSIFIGNGNTNISYRSYAFELRKK